MSGQSVMDRMQAARHSVLGSQIGKKVCKATTEEILAPKRKHLEDLLQYTHDPNVNVTDIIDLLLSRTHNQNWVVVYKSLVTLHHLMCYGHEKVIQNMASRTMELNLANYYDRKDMQGAQMSPFIQRYSKYLSAKAGSYRAMAFDFCNAKRGKEEGKLRNMEAHELLMALPTLSDHLDALLEFQRARKEAQDLCWARPSDLTNGIVVASFMLLFKDSIRLFASYNEGIINLLEKFFDMSSKKQCEQALNSYKKFLQQMENVGKFLKVAEEYGIDKGDIPDLTSAPSSLLDALESHYQGLETDKKGGGGGKTKERSKPIGVPKQLSVNADAFREVSQKTTSNNPFFFEEANEEFGGGAKTSISEADRQKALEEEKTELSKYNNQTQSSFNPFSTDASSQSVAAAKAPTPTVNDPFEDLLGLSSGGTTTSAQSTPSAANDPFGSSTPASGNTFDPFASFNATSATAAPQPSASSNPFLQNEASTGRPYLAYPASPAPKFSANAYANNHVNTVRFHVNHMPQPQPRLVGPSLASPYVYSSTSAAVVPPSGGSMFGGTVSGSMWQTNEGTSDMPAADNVKASSITNNFGPNYSIDIENELGTLDFGSANISMEAKHDTTSVAVNSDSAQDEKGTSYQPAYAPPAQQTVNFEAAFGTNSTSYGTKKWSSNVFGDMLQPTPIGGQQSHPQQQNMLGGRASPMGMGGSPALSPMGTQKAMGTAQSKHTDPGLGKDLDSALANLATSLNTKSPSHRPSQPQQTAW
ncbi:phosphatidylinositol-binding clathrin assembly protein LAP-like isoform X3 [Symsagittifera roscoffensis]|uniref:phosphatidylinositol-binding clathrin assembly protein LAP-like isoform X3 n=1 Tax=Symsagittifera roscoffensis TaxID=84072 RepID=UPI00307C6E28